MKTPSRHPGLLEFIGLMVVVGIPYWFWLLVIEATMSERSALALFQFTTWMGIGGLVFVWKYGR